MRSFFWIKLHHAILDDPKMGLLPDALWRRVIELFLLAGEKHEQGVLPPLREMVWRVHTTEEILTEELVQLSEVGIVEQRDSGWFVTDFARLQAPTPSTERSQNHRERQRRLTYKGPEGAERSEIQTADDVHEAATDLGRTPDATGTKRPTDIDEETDRDRDVESIPPGGGVSSRDPPSKAQSPPKRQPLTDGQRRFLELFSASRYRNETQKATILELERTYGIAALLDKGRWAAKLGMSLGKAVVAVESAFKNERKSNGRNEQRSTRARSRRGQAAGRGLDTGSDEEVQRGLTRSQMQAKLARLERTDGRAGSSAPENL